MKWTNRTLCPVRGFARRLGSQKSPSMGEAPVFDRHILRLLVQPLKLAACFSGIDRERVSNQCLRSGGGEQIFAAGFEMVS